MIELKSRVVKLEDLDLLLNNSSELCELFYPVPKK